MNTIMKAGRRMRLLAYVGLLLAGSFAAYSQTASTDLQVIMTAPTNGEAFLAPASIFVHAQVADSNIVKTVRFFSGTNNIGIAVNGSAVLLTNISTASPFYFVWSNVVAGSYKLTAVANDIAGNITTSAPVAITVTNPPPPPPTPFVVSFLYPTNGEAFLAPANIGVHALLTDSNVVETVQYFSGTNSIGIVTNAKGALLTNISTASPFYMDWTNVLAGSYILTAVASDSVGNMATSAPVTITVTNPPPPPPIPFDVSFLYPTKGETFVAPAYIGVNTLVTDSNVVESVQYFSGTNSIGVVTNTKSVLLTNISTVSPFFMTWSNDLAGTYILTAVATDSAGHTATSAPVVIFVTNPPPPPSVPYVVTLLSPINGETFLAPANIGVHALVTDSNAVATVQYFSGSNSIGIVTNTGALNPFFMTWSNVPAGDYILTAVATDSAGYTAISKPVNIYVATNLPPVVTIFAPDPVAVVGTNYTNCFKPPTAVTNYFTGSNTATFLVRRDSSTNADLTVSYSIGGTASNGVDYATIPNTVTILAGQRYALITIVPLNNTNGPTGYYETVVLSLTAPTNSPPPYAVGSPAKAGAIILEANFLPIPRPMAHNMADNSIHVSLPATNGMNFSVQISTDLVNWQPLVTNTVLKGSAQFVDPNGPASPQLFYRIVPSATAAY